MSSYLVRPGRPSLSPTHKASLAAYVGVAVAAGPVMIAAVTWGNGPGPRVEQLLKHVDGVPFAAAAKVLPGVDLERLRESVAKGTTLIAADVVKHAPTAPAARVQRTSAPTSKHNAPATPVHDAKTATASTHASSRQSSSSTHATSAPAALPAPTAHDQGGSPSTPSNPGKGNGNGNANGGNGNGNGNGGRSSHLTGHVPTSVLQTATAAENPPVAVKVTGPSQGLGLGHRATVTVTVQPAVITSLAVTALAQPAQATQKTQATQATRPAHATQATQTTQTTTQHDHVGHLSHVTLGYGKHRAGKHAGPYAGEHTPAAHATGKPVTGEHWQGHHHGGKHRGANG